MTSRQWTIYALKDPRTGEIRYVGWTQKNMPNRINHHLYQAISARTHVHKWILALKKDGLKPDYDILETGIGDGWGFAEQTWIARMRSLGCRLTNIAAGGQGSPGHVVTEETRAKMSATHSTPEARAKKAAVLSARVLSPETRAKLSRAAKARTPEVAARLANSNRGKRRSAETVAAIAARSKGRRNSPEAIAKVADQLRGRKQPPEIIVKRVAMLTGKKRSGAALENIRASAQRRDNAAIAAKKRGAKRSGETRARMRAAWVLRRQDPLKMRNLGRRKLVGA